MLAAPRQEQSVARASGQPQPLACSWVIRTCIFVNRIHTLQVSRISHSCLWPHPAHCRPPSLNIFTLALSQRSPGTVGEIRCLRWQPSCTIQCICVLIQCICRGLVLSAVGIVKRTRTLVHSLCLNFVSFRLHIIIAALGRVLTSGTSRSDIATPGCWGKVPAPSGERASTF